MFQFLNYEERPSFTAPFRRIVGSIVSWGAMAISGMLLIGPVVAVSLCALNLLELNRYSVVESTR